jgi:hypothetical protein
MSEERHGDLDQTQVPGGKKQIGVFPALAVQHSSSENFLVVRLERKVYGKGKTPGA